MKLEEEIMLHSFGFDFDKHGVIIIVLISISAAYIQRIFITLVGGEKLKVCHEVGGYYLAIIGALYAVISGLVVFDAMNNFHGASTAVKDEAKSVLAVYSLAEQLPEKDKVKIRALTSAYVNEVIDKEWPMMSQFTHSQKAGGIMFNLMEEIKRVEPVTENQKAVFPILLEEILMAWENRRERIEQSEAAIPSIEWVALISGAVITVFFTYFFSISFSLAQSVMTFLVTLFIGLNLYLVYCFGEPFTGELHISDRGFVVIRNYIMVHP